MRPFPDTLLEAELFGVEAGAFTDAKRTKPGLFEAASGGTLFLDEIAALPLALQGKCLTAIEAKRVRRVGAVVEQPVDVKLIAATQVELSAQVQAGHFRADLYHRLAVVVLELPPLRARGDDILVLARAFLQQYSAAYGVRLQRLSKAAESWLFGYPWPGNVRELSHLLERIVLLEPATVIDPESLARRCLSQPGPAVPVDAPLPPRPDASLNEPERLTEALRQSGGNLARAARLLGMSRGSLRYRLHKYGLDRPSRHPPSLLRREESGARGAEAPIVFSPQEGEGQGERVFAHRDESPVGLRHGESRAPIAGWEPKPVAVLAIEATWPERSETEGRPYEPWTLASRWEQRMAEKVAGFGGVILQGSPSLCLVAFGLPQTLEQLPQRAVQAALAIRHLAAEAQASAGETAGPVVRLAGHLGTLLVAEEGGAVSRALAGGGRDVGPAGAAARACGAGGAAGIRPDGAADRRVGGGADMPAALWGRVVSTRCWRTGWWGSCRSGLHSRGAAGGPARRCWDAHTSWPPCRRCWPRSKAAGARSWGSWGSLGWASRGSSRNGAKIWQPMRSPTWKGTVGPTAAPCPTCPCLTCCGRTAVSRPLTVPRPWLRRSERGCRRWTWLLPTGPPISCACWRSS